MLIDHEIGLREVFYPITSFGIAEWLVRNIKD
jgi:hypothetical protein